MKITLSFALLFSTCGQVVSQNATTLPTTSALPSTEESHHPSGAPSQPPTQTPTVPTISEVPSTKESHHPSGAPSQQPTQTRAPSQPPSQTPTAPPKKPNLIMIMTDEHNLRTLGCYRDLMDEKQAFPWGEGVKVDTPNIDQLAKDGAVYKNFYTVSPRK